jgi:hypothetical protein
MNKTIIGIALLIYNFALVAGTAWLVALHDWSGWWFLLTGMLLMSIKDKEDRHE